MDIYYIKKQDLFYSYCMNLDLPKGNWEKYRFVNNQLVQHDDSGTLMSTVYSVGSFYQKPYNRRKGKTACFPLFSNYMQVKELNACLSRIDKIDYLRDSQDVTEHNLVKFLLRMDHDEKYDFMKREKEKERLRKERIKKEEEEQEKKEKEEEEKKKKEEEKKKKKLKPVKEEDEEEEEGEICTDENKKKKSRKINFVP